MSGFRKEFFILALLLFVFIVTSIFEPAFLGAGNIQDNLKWAGLYSFISIGVAFVIISGGIDLSIGSVMALVATLLGLLLERGWSIPVVVVLVMLVSVVIGTAHGLLITKLRLQPFVVTLCGLLIYRGLARFFTEDISVGFSDFPGFRLIATERILGLPAPFVYTIGLGVLATVLLNFTVFGRYLFALGRNEQAARLSGINTDRTVILAYVICSGLAGLCGIVFALSLNSVQPKSFANFYELYAIAGAVLGGCSLRGGEGSIPGVVLGAMLLSVLYNACFMLDVPTQLIDAVIGVTLLLGVVVDEVVKRVVAARRRAARAG